MATQEVVFLDIETDSLDPVAGSVLEIYAKVYTASVEDQMPPFHRIIRYVQTGAMSDVVRRMHMRSGLLAACDSDAASDYWQSMLDLYQWVMCVRGDGPPVKVGGFSPHFDRGFLVTKLPSLAEHMSHQVVDVSTVRHLFTDAGVEFPAYTSVEHRAKSDVLLSMKLYDFARVSLMCLDDVHKEYTKLMGNE